MTPCVCKGWVGRGQWRAGAGSECERLFVQGEGCRVSVEVVYTVGRSGECEDP